MSLREHVCDDDVDTAIATLIVSFINAQKCSVCASLERGFRKFLTRGSDYFELLLYELRSLLRDAQTYATLRSSEICTHVDFELKILAEDFEARARGLDICGNLDECVAVPFVFWI